MIYKNEDGCNVIQFGTGDVEVCNGRVPSNSGDKMFPCLILNETKPGEIGAFCHPESINDPAEERCDANTMLVFTDIRSFDVLIDHLNQAKNRFKKNKFKVMTPQEITDEM